MATSISISADCESEEREVLTLAGDITVFVAAELHHNCVHLAQRTGHVLVDCEQVQSVDATGLQILVAFQDALAAQGGRLELTGLSKDVADTIRLAGLANRLTPHGAPECAS